MFKADFDGYKVVCAFCSSRLLKKELPDCTNDLNSAYRAGNEDARRRTPCRSCAA